MLDRVRGITTNSTTKCLYRFGVTSQTRAGDMVDIDDMQVPTDQNRSNKKSYVMMLWGKRPGGKNVAIIEVGSISLNINCEHKQ